MANAARKITVETTPGVNARIEPVLRLEDLLQQLQKAAPPRGRGSGRGLAEMRQLAGDLARKLREARSG